MTFVTFDQFRFYLCPSRDRNRVYQPCQALRGRSVSDSYRGIARHRRVTGRSEFCFVVITLDDTVERVLYISQIPVDPATIYLCNICLPTPTTLLLFEASNIRCYHLPDLSELSPGNRHLAELSPVWSWESPTHPKARSTANSLHWELGRTAPTVGTLLCDFLSHTITLRPSEKASGGPSHLDVTDHTYVNQHLPINLPSRYQGTTLLRSNTGLWFRLGNTAGPSYYFVTISTDDAQCTGLVILDISKAGTREHLVSAVNFDEVSGRIVVLARALGRQSHMEYVFIVDMP